MASHERRITPRFNLHTPLSFNRQDAHVQVDEQANAINVSTSGVCFITRLRVSVGDFIEVLMEIPRRITGMKAVSRRFTGRVTHIEPQNMPEGVTKIGVQFLYYELLDARAQTVGSPSDRNAVR
jgi:PilZ domain